MQKIGKNPRAPFCAFGDDSKYKEILVYSYATFKREHIEKAERRINQIKQFFDIPESVHLHCRQLFSGAQRNKIGLDHLDIVDIQKLIARIIERMNSIPCLLNYAFCRLDERIKYEEMYPDDEEIIFHEDPKAIQGLLSQSCFLPAKGYPLAEDIEIFASYDKTRTKYCNNKKMRADRLSGGVNRYATKIPNNDNKIEPHILAKDHPLQQVADVYAYTIAHALSKKPNNAYFQVQLKKVKFWTNHEIRNDIKPTQK